MNLDVSFLTRALQTFIGVFGGGFGHLQTVINALLAVVVIIELALLGLWTALNGGGSDQIAAVIKKIIFIGFWIWLIQNFPSLSQAFVRSLVAAGLIAGGSSVTVSQILDPSALVNAGLNATQPLAQKLGEFGSFDMADMLIFGAGYIVIMGCYCLMAVNLFLAVVEYYIFAGIVGVLLPFGILQPTKFLAEKAIGAVVSAGLKLMVLSFVTSAVLPLIVASRFPGDDETWNMNALWAAQLIMIGTTALCWKAPGLAASLMSGAPSLGVDHVIGAAQTALSAGVGAAMGATSLATGNAGLALSSAGSLTSAASSAGASAAAGPPPVPQASASLVRSLAA